MYNPQPSIKQTALQEFHSGKTVLLTKFNDTPRGIRIPVASVKGRCPRPLDDGGLFFRHFQV